MNALQERTEDLETKLKGVRMVLQEKVEQLKEQVGLQKGAFFKIGWVKCWLILAQRLKGGNVRLAQHSEPKMED